MYWKEEQSGPLVAEDDMSPRFLAEYTWSPNSSCKAGVFHLE